MDPPARIVIVEDESVTALDVARQLRRLGYQVVALARTGPEAISHALAHRPDVVLMDIRLQGAMDGIEAARRYCQLNQTICTASAQCGIIMP